MPYNNTPIAPPREVTGQVSLPLARVKKIIATDDDISNCSNNAAFVITVAAEMFLQHLTEQTYNIVKSGGGGGEGRRESGKVRRNVQYRDVANAVARVENLEFLADVVPKTTTYRSFKQKQNQNQASGASTTTIGAQQSFPQPQQQANGPPLSTTGQGALDSHMTTAGTTITSRPTTSSSAGMPISEQLQAVNGASPRVQVQRVDGADDMDVDVEIVDKNDDTEDIEEEGTEGSMHTANDEPYETVRPASGARTLDDLVRRAQNP